MANTVEMSLASESESAKTSKASLSILTFAVEGRPRASRTKNTKSRSGCITCKKRRVRCDEAKPTCGNCAKSKRQCEGYLSKASPADYAKHLLESRPLLIKPCYESHMFTDQLQKDHFDYWMAFTREFTLFPSDLMSHMIPQIAREEPAIRHAAFAIGAAAMCNDSRTQRLSGGGPFRAEALWHYGKAIRIIRNSEPSKKSIPRAILACLLFITFESLQGNYQEALEHMNHGSNILDQITRQGVQGGECPPKLVDEIFNGFRRFSLLSWSLNGYHPPETDNFVPWCCRGNRTRYAVDEMPATFENPVEAQRWWEIVQHYIVYKAKFVSGIRFPNNDPREPLEGSPLSREDSKKYLALTQAWRDRFNPLMQRAARHRATSPKEHLQMTNLRLMCMSLEITIRSLHGSDMAYLAAATSKFKGIVALSRIVLSGQKEQMGPDKEVFSMDSSPSWALLLAGIFCHDENVRDDVRRLFQEYPRRDALWDSKAIEAALRVGQTLWTESNGDYERHVQGISDNKEIIFGRNEIRRRRYRVDEATGSWRIEREHVVPYDVQC
ncbi:Aspercryptin biosynthesis cluster-specific transcription regulator atnN [Colletotrichum trifolii]|uniref:Aspercryptin biosynthesis cluster-specific transcription regulator atnN n=1 Tax=Colletotrichum trifolii TaxID=5466 RepID=A0A4R8QMM7_COLTR|nr:Aspercryptin biosynthesis cluster-specific transcription regulator atnN [Colletotrichum trifolii]